jgi:hypothetical protein
LITEEEKLSCATGELIHGLGNLLADGKIQIGELTANDGKLLQDLGDALRRESLSDSYQALTDAGIRPTVMTRAEIVDAADSILNRAV